MDELAGGSHEILLASESLTDVSINVKDYSDIIESSQEAVDSQMKINLTLSEEMENILSKITGGIEQINNSMSTLTGLSNTLTDASKSTHATIEKLENEKPKKSK